MKSEFPGNPGDAFSFVLGLLDAAERRAFIEELPTSAAARARLDEAEELAASVAVGACRIKPRRETLTRALARINAGETPVARPFEFRRWGAWIGWAAAAVLVCGGVRRMETQRRTIHELKQEVAAEASRPQVFPPRALASGHADSSRSPGASGGEKRGARGRSAMRIDRATANPLEAQGEFGRNVLHAVHESGGLRDATEKLRERAVAGTMAASESLGLESVFVELRGPGELPSQDQGKLLAGIVADHMSAAAAAMDALMDRAGNPNIVGEPAAEGSFELYDGIWEMGEGILFSEETGLLMVPRGDGRTYDYRKPGPGFNAEDIAGTRMQLAEQARLSAAEQAQDLAGLAQSVLPRAYVYADRQSGEGFVLVRRLPELGEGEVYRLYQNTASPELIGDLPEYEEGSNEAVLQLPQPSSAGEGFLITRERAGIVEGTPGEVVLVGQ